MGTILFEVKSEYLGGKGQSERFLYEINESDRDNALQAVRDAMKSWHQFEGVYIPDVFVNYVENEFRHRKIQFIRKDVTTIKASLQLTDFAAKNGNSDAVKNAGEIPDDKALFVTFTEYRDGALGTCIHEINRSQFDEACQAARDAGKLWNKGDADISRETFSDYLERSFTEHDVEHKARYFDSIRLDLDY